MQWAVLQALCVRGALPERVGGAAGVDQAA